MYKPPKVRDNEFKCVFDQFINDIYSKYSNEVILGDLNINVSRQTHCLNEKMNTYGLINVITSSICYQNAVKIQAKLHISKRVPKTVFYRKYRHFNETKYQQDIMYTLFHVADIFNEKGGRGRSEKSDFLVNVHDMSRITCLSEWLKSLTDRIWDRMVKCQN